MTLRNIRENILTAREKRAFLRQQCSVTGHACLSLSLNIPGYPKRDPLFSAFFDAILAEFKQFLLARRIFFETETEVCAGDEAGDFYLAPLSADNRLTPAEIKTVCERFEEHHAVGRVIDIDVTDHQGLPVSSGKLKPCFLCDNAAIECMREQHHAYHELRDGIAARMTEYLRQQHEGMLCKRLAAIALKATLYEISVSPKPGLVDRFDSGAHQDMDYFSFLSSSAALAAYFEEFARAGLAFDDDDLMAALPIIRDTGLKMEHAMFEATGGVNTHKGLIFLLGLSIFASAFVLARNDAFHPSDVRNTIAGICRNLVRKELGKRGNDSTHGAQCFHHYGRTCGGARQEAEEGFPAVFDHGLPELRAQFSSLNDPVESTVMNAALTQTLLRLMTVVDDTNIIYRKDPSTLDTVKRMAYCVLESGAKEDRSLRYTELIDYCRQEQVSPGGSADLLAVTVFFYCVESAFSSKD